MSFSLDLAGLMDYAAQIFNALQGIVVIIGGFALGMGIVKFVLNQIRSLGGGG